MEKGYGISEEIIGRWLVQGGRRERIVLATKVYQPMGTGPNDRRLSAYHIRRACEASLRRLKTDHIDLYQMHHIDRATPWEEVWQAMEQLIREGKIAYVGSSNFAGWDIATAQCAAASRNLLGLASEQSLYNLAERTIELEVIPAAAASRSARIALCTAIRHFRRNQFGTDGAAWISKQRTFPRQVPPPKRRNSIGSPVRKLHKV